MRVTFQKSEKIEISTSDDTQNSDDVGKSAHPRFLRYLCSELREGWPTVLFLTSVLTILHHYHFLEWFTTTTMRLVYTLEQKGHMPGVSFMLEKIGIDDNGALPFLRSHEHAAAQSYIESLKKAAPSDDSITLLRFTPEGYENVFEGRQPLPRGCIADVIEALIPRLPEEPPFPIVAFDMDLTPRGEPATPDAKNSSETKTESSGADSNQTSSEQSSRIACKHDPNDIGSVLRDLSQRATVISLIFKRNNGDQKDRDEFIRQHCSEYPRDGDGHPKKDDGRGVFFSSPNIFNLSNEPVYKFPARQKKAERQWFPSLGVLVGLANQLDKYKEKPTCRNKCEKIKAAAVATLESACSDIKNNRPFIGDATSTDNPSELAEILEPFQKLKINHLQSSYHILTRDLSALSDLSNALIRSKIIMVSVDDGSSADRFYTPADINGNTSGAFVHAAVAYSVSHPMEDSDHWENYILDIAIGFLFIILVSTMMHHPEKYSVERPFVRVSAGRAIPLLVGTFLLALSFYISAVALKSGIWLDPLFMTLGMLLHSYADTGNLTYKPAHSGHQQHCPAHMAGVVPRYLEKIRHVLDISNPSAQRQQTDQIFASLWIVAFFVVIIWALIIIVE